LRTSAVAGTFRFRAGAHPLQGLCMNHLLTQGSANACDAVGFSALKNGPHLRGAGRSPWICTQLPSHLRAEPCSGGAFSCHEAWLGVRGQRAGVEPWPTTEVEHPRPRTDPDGVADPRHRGVPCPAGAAPRAATPRPLARGRPLRVHGTTRPLHGPPHDLQPRCHRLVQHRGRPAHRAPAGRRRAVAAGRRSRAGRDPEIAVTLLMTIGLLQRQGRTGLHRDFSAAAAAPTTTS